MKHISIIIPEGDCSITHIEASHQILSEVNVFLAGLDRDPLLKIELVGLNKESVLKKGFYTVHHDKTIADINKTDLIIIPALQGSDMETAVQLNQGYVSWMLAQHRNGAEIASLCLGSFLLASTGLLKNKKCTTHWSAANHFRRMFPDVELVPEKILIDENGIYSSGGALSFTNLLLYLIEKYAGRDIAILASKTFMIDIDRDRQSPFIIFKAQKDHEDEPILKAQNFIEKNYAEKLTVDELASMFALGRRNLERRFKKATSNTVVEYIQRVKIEAAKFSLESSYDNVNEVMYKVGYNDTKAFRTTFRKITGLSPIQYRTKFKQKVGQ
ncbi:MAG: helix-turn-helix domain-containing protein [Chitinophagaceae bacterium]|nr:helix-turn-helix domain-containing protein [Chitinophagaceae bacterium]